jgi:hypothetical protein
MQTLSDCIDSCSEEFVVDSDGQDAYVVESPSGHISIVSSHHLTFEKKKYLCELEQFGEDVVLD